ncbi:hypothetical protein M1116_02385 [Patescibacteria group bacterium]|nr:hypothetical protein [Patescibacteria group bacterium]
MGTRNTDLGNIVQVIDDLLMVTDRGLTDSQREEALGLAHHILEFGPVDGKAWRFVQQAIREARETRAVDVEIKKAAKVTSDQDIFDEDEVAILY